MKEHTTKVRGSTKNILRQATLPLVMLSLALACLMGTRAASAEQEKAHVRVVHASSKTGPVDVFMDGKEVLKNFSFGNVSNYSNLPAGKHELKITPTGKGEKAAVLTATANVQPKGFYTIAATSSKNGDLGLKAFKDDNTGNKKEAKVRVYHFSPDLGAVNVTRDNKAIIKDLNFEQASDYVTVPAGNDKFEASSTNTDKKLPIQANIKDGKVYSVFVLGELKGKPALTYKVKTTDMESVEMRGSPTANATPHTKSTATATH
ncbi:DUF4397 domain-containing protein [Ktedonospora formicarum]|uniref:Cell wall anchor n=1 Tax=Ktedonospora formicarum TaxID=2778364 RepID=A0A8J3IDD2_9CHLR|nr:DUF4397 domain-containing protein [Ktedonospora formicarum]GHO50193.1 cell wall anchor [Ktedonospora formicarum]